MKQKQATPLLIVCIALLFFTGIFLTIYLCLIMAWGWEYKPYASLFEIRQFSEGILIDILVIVLFVASHITFYQLAIRSGLKTVTEARLTAVILTPISAFVVLFLPIQSIVDGLLVTIKYNRRPLLQSNDELVIIALVLLSTSYIVGIIYAMRHYPKVKKEKVKTD